MNKNITAATMMMSIVAAAVPSAANASISGSSSAYSLSADVHAVAGLAAIHVGPLPGVGGAAPTPYFLTNSALTAQASALGVASLSTGLLSTAASSDIGPGTGTGIVQAQSAVNNLSLRVVPGALFIPDLLSLAATTISSHASLRFDGAQVVSSGGSRIEGGSLSVSGVGALAVTASAAPNTVLLNAGGIKIVLNEQIFSTVGQTTTLDVNAIRVTINGPLHTVAADVVVGHSAATLTVPAPATVTCPAMLACLAGRRRRQTI